MNRRSTRIRYGSARHQFGLLTIGDGPAPVATVVLVHGGFWSWPYSRVITALIARNAAAAGFDVLNTEYRRLGRFGGGGGWPATFEDVCAAVRLAKERRPDGRVFVIGHSAGGHLALVAAARHPELVDGVVAIAAPTDIRALSESGSPAVDELVRDAPSGSVWRLTSPIEMVPIGVPTVCVHSDTDTTVHRRMSIRYIDAAVAAGDDARLVLVAGERHRDALLPRSDTWTQALAAVVAWVDAGHANSRIGVQATKDDL